MLARRFDTFTPGYAQPKLDGMRCMATRIGLFSRSGLPVRMPHIRRTLDGFFKCFPDAVLDGELYNHAYAGRFDTLIGLCRRGGLEAEAAGLQYHLFDYPSAAGGFAARWAALAKQAGPGRPMDLAECGPIRTVATRAVDDVDDFDALFEGWTTQGYEGAIWRDGRGGYSFGARSPRLKKRVVSDTAEFPVVRLKQGAVVCRTATGREFGAVLGRARAANSALEHRVPAFATLRFKGLTSHGVPRCAAVRDWHGPAGRLD